MEIITNKIKKDELLERTVAIIKDELFLLKKSGQEKRQINLSLDLKRPEYIRAEIKSDEHGTSYHCQYFRQAIDSTRVDVWYTGDIYERHMDEAIKIMLNSISNMAEKEAFERKCYELYQLEWMMSHGYSLNDLYKVMEKSLVESAEDGEMDMNQVASNIRSEFLYEKGFGNGSLFVCKEEFLGAEYQDAAYMKWLFETQVDNEADRLKALYAKYTGKQLSCVPDLKVHTEAGTLNAYKSADYGSEGITIMLQPKGRDAEINVALVGTSPNSQDVNIAVWGDATMEHTSHEETLLWSDVEKALKPRVLSKEELKAIIFNEWKKFTFYDGENISADEIDNVPQDLLDEIAFRCDSLETDDITQNIIACLEYAKEHGTRALIKEMDDCNIWRYIG